MLAGSLRKNRALQGKALTGLVFLSLLLLAGIALAPASRATREVSQEPATNRSNKKRTRPAFVPGEALVRYKSEAVAKLQLKAAVVESDDGKRMPLQVERFDGSEIVSGLRIARMAPEDTMAAIEALKKQPDVLYAEPNYIWHSDATPNDPRFSEQYGVNKIGAPQAWDITTGSSNVVVGVIDEGIDLNHQDLQANIWVNPAPGSVSGITGDLNGYNFIENTGTIPAEEHGSHVAGIAGAVGNNGIGVVGVNWNVRLMSLRALGSSGGDTADFIRAYNYARQMRELWISSNGASGANIRVLNNSYGGTGFSQSVLNAISALNQSGILFVASAGNDAEDGDAIPHYPSGYALPNVVSVASTTSADALSSSSNFGVQSVTLGAPGSGILSTTPNNTYSTFSGTSMASPHVAGSAALVSARAQATNTNLTTQQLKALLIFNGDLIPSLLGKTLTGRRLNVSNSLQALAENDLTPPGTPTNLNVSSQNGRSINLGWINSGDDGASGQASLYQLSFTDGATGVVIPLKSVLPGAFGSQQSLDVKLPYRHTVGTVTLREFDNVGNEGTPATLNVSVPLSESDPYLTSVGSSVALSTGGTLLPELNFDDRYKADHPLPFAFPFFGQSFNSVTISTNGNLYFSTPPKRSNGDADDVPGSTADLPKFKMIAGLWDDLYLGTDQRADAGVFAVQPDSSRIIFRWQGVPCNSGSNGACEFGGSPINFEIEIRSDGTIKTRYGSGNTNLFPVVGISGGEPEAYVVESHTSEQVSKSLTNAQEVTFLPRGNPLENRDFFVNQHYRDFLERDADAGGLSYWMDQLAACGTDADCIRRRRVGVSAAFFVELEFQRTGYVVYRMYRAAYGTVPNTTTRANITFAQFIADRALLPEGSDIAQTTISFANAFVQRSEFLAAYPASLTNTQFVTKLFDTAGLTPYTTERQQQIDAMTNNGKTRAQVLLDVIEIAEFKTREYNRSFVLMQYFGYLRRDPDQGGYDFWLGIVNNPSVSNYRSMVCAFLTSREYQERFSTIVPRNDTECANIN